MRLKGVRELEKFLTGWLRAAGFTDVRARAAADFGYDPEDGIIYFSFGVTEKIDTLFLKFCQDELGFPYDCDNFIISFFHELGHHITYFDYSDKEWKEYYKRKKKLEDAPNSEYKYFSLPMEMAATRWGCSYIERHADLINDFWEQCQKLLMDIYRLNGVDVA